MIRNYADVYKSSLKKLQKYQSGELKPIKTDRPWLDDTFGGILPGDVITIGGASGAGKSFELQRLLNNIFKLNDSSNYVCLQNSLEMRNLSTLLRDFKISLNKSKKSILTEEFTEEEKEILRDYSKMYTDGRFFINEETESPTKFAEDWEKFLQDHTDKEAVFITFDHAALVKGGNKEGIDDLLAKINELKGKYENAIFILLTQLNRQILGRIAEKNSMSAPQRSDVYASDTLFFLSDHVYVIQNANRIGINEYMKVSSSHYDYLEDFFSEEGDKVSFLTYGNMFYHILKSREADVVYRDLYIEAIEVPERKEPEVKKQSFSLDAFENGNNDFEFLDKEK